MSTIQSVVRRLTERSVIAIRRIFRWLGWIPVVWWTFTILGFSSQPYTEQSIQPWLRDQVTEARLSSLLPDTTLRYHHAVIHAKQEPYRFVEFIFRKSAHLFVYAVLAVLTYTAIKPWLRDRPAVLLLVSLSYVLVFSLVDEWRQSLNPMRTSTIQDVAVDVAGGVIGLLCLTVSSHLLKLKQNKRYGCID
ncbi:VanZ family protein [Paenibacillus abyssi]|uniref:VanZ-like domain-containing protein n=1 Tax=Paenibacillus abyssi TaxID=1340531 RepID=A0A917CU78_9BACL|nr:VanZ family protein [Paenibacillus abyssi]GGF98485.1 hypothetical protein GCM10010916_14660 [Paenibacillus abyssi]